MLNPIMLLANIDVLPTLIEGAIGALGGTIVTGLVGITQYIELKNGHEKPIRVPSNHKRNLILLVGLGGTGKTSLIRSLFQDPRANYRKRTEWFEMYDYTRKIRNGTYHLFISDYKGQNIAQLIRAFIVQQKNESYSRLAFGYINSLIIMVDLFPPNSSESLEETSKKLEVDTRRITHNIEQWNETSLSMLSGLFTEELKSVILFINKVDLLSNASDEAQLQCKKKYSILKERIEKVFNKDLNGVECHVILGSAMNGMGIVGADHTNLESLLLSSSTPARG